MSPPNLETVKNNVIFVPTFHIKVRQYFNNTDNKNVTDDKKLWNTITPKVSNVCKKH